MTAGQIAEYFDCAKPTLSAHFSVLREADLVESEKVGTTVTYSLNDTRFAIDAATGVITRSATGTLDFETQPSINLTVTATSSDGSTALIWSWVT